MVKYQLTELGADLCTDLEKDEMTAENLAIRRAPDWDKHGLCDEGELAFTIDFELEAFDHVPRDVYDVVFLRPEHYITITATPTEESF